jgi:hypothetical protein
MKTTQKPFVPFFVEELLFTGIDGLSGQEEQSAYDSIICQREEVIQ